MIHVLVSATIKFQGAEARILNLIAAHQLRAYVSEPVLAEDQEVFFRLHLRLDVYRVASTLRLMLAEGTLVQPGMRLSISRDESDNRFLECAEASDADYLITGNQRHFPTRWKQTEIVNARELQARLASQ